MFQQKTKIENETTGRHNMVEERKGDQFGPVFLLIRAKFEFCVFDPVPTQNIQPDSGKESVTMATNC